MVWEDCVATLGVVRDIMKAAEKNGLSVIGDHEDSLNFWYEVSDGYDKDNKPNILIRAERSEYPRLHGTSGGEWTIISEAGEKHFPDGREVCHYINNTIKEAQLKLAQKVAK